MRELRSPGRQDFERYSPIKRNPPSSIALLALINAGLLAWIGLLHLGLSIGVYWAPKAIWVAPVELFAAACLLIAAGAVSMHLQLAREIAWIANGIAFWCVLLGLFACAIGLASWARITGVDYVAAIAVTVTSTCHLHRWQNGPGWPL